MALDRREISIFDISLLTGPCSKVPIEYWPKTLWQLSAMMNTNDKIYAKKGLRSLEILLLVKMDKVVSHVNWFNIIFEQTQWGYI